jgi:hypothetical protein
MLEVIVTVHDQNIILAFESAGKYRHVPKYTYAFVGAGDCDKIEHLSNVIIVRNLPDNIEQYKNLVDFTAWYAFVKNNLIGSPYVALLQYDTAITDDFYTSTVDKLQNKSDFLLGYQFWEMMDENFLSNNVGAKPLFDALLDAYGVDLYQMIEAHIAQFGDDGWPSSNNYATSHDVLRRYVQWLEPMISSLGPNLYSGHSIERSIKMFCMVAGINISYAADLAHHYQLNSHGTQGFTVDFKKQIKKVANNTRPESNKLWAFLKSQYGKIKKY